MMRSSSSDFLSEVRTYFSDHEDATGEWQALQQLAAHAATTTDAISYRLQLAAAAEKNGQKENAAALLSRTAVAISLAPPFGSGT